MDEAVTEIFDVDFDDKVIKAPEIRLAYEYWLKKRANNEMPSVEDIDILDLVATIGAISLIDVVDQTPRFRLRMVGSNIVKRYGNDLTGQYIDQIEDEVARNKLLSSYGKTFMIAKPFWIERNIFEEGQVYVHECLILPLRGNSNKVVRLMSILHWPEKCDAMKP